jgi:hypothetical protein
MPTDTTGPQPLSLSGACSGGAMPGSQTWNVQIQQSGSTLNGTLRIGSASGTLSNSSISGTNVHLEARLRQGATAAKVVFEGNVNSAGTAITGAWREATAGSGTIALQRG